MRSTAAEARTALLALAVFAAAAAAFSPALGNGFVNWDDPVNLLRNPRYRGLGWENIRWMFTQLHFGMYQPLAWLTFACDYLLWGMRPGGYHLTSVLIHSFNAVLFFLLGRDLLGLAVPARTAEERQRLDWGAAWAALFFALHPLRVEAVAWATERRELLCAAFCLLAVRLYVRGSRSWAWGAFILALLSKAMAITLPVVLFILDLYPLRRRLERALLIEKLWFLLPSALIAALGWLGQTQAGEIPRYMGQELAARLGQAAYGLAFYVWKTILPLDLSPLYLRPARASLLEPRFALALAAAVAVSWALWRLRRRWPAGLAAWACYAVILSPVLGLIPIGPQLTADRYSYLSCFGFALLAGAGLRRLLARPGAAAWALPAAALLAGTWGALSWRQSMVWRDDESLWSHAVAATPANPVVRSFLGNVRLEQGRLAEAEALYRQAVALDPDYAAAHNNLAEALSRQGAWEKALPHYAEAARLQPSKAAVHHNWAAALRRLGRGAEAARHFEEARADSAEAAARTGSAPIFP